MEYSPPGSSVHGIFQARILEWVAISLTQGFNLGREALLASSPPSSEVGGKPGEREVLRGHSLVAELLGDSGIEAPSSPSIRKKK